jgi:hypothetical protein
MNAPKLLSPEEAWEVISSGSGFVSAAGYTYFKDGYLSYGTLPACMSGTGHTKEGFLQQCERQSLFHWRPMTPEDLICRHGYYPSVYTLVHHYNAIGGFTTEQIQEVYALETEMIEYCINSQHDAAVFRDGARSPEVWRTWFKQRSWDRWAYFKEHFPDKFKNAEVVLSYPEFLGDLEFAEYLMDEAGVPTQPPE